MTILTYQYRSKHKRCYSCRCTNLPTDTIGCCQRCNDGWLGFIDLETSSEDLLRRELRLAEHAKVSEEMRSRIGSRLDLELGTLIESIKEELKGH